MSYVVSSLYSQVPQSGLVPPQNTHLQRFPFVFLIDTSGSTGVGPDPDINHINAALATILGNLKNPPLNTPLRHQNKQVDVCIIAYSSGVNIVQDWSTIQNVPASIPPLTASGGTQMAAGMRAALAKIGERFNYYKSEGMSWGRSHIIHLIDGAPADMSPGDATWNDIAARLHKLDGTNNPEKIKTAVIHYCSPGGFGSSSAADSGMENLKKMSGDQSVFSLTGEIGNFETVAKMVTEFVTIASSDFPPDDAVAKAKSAAVPLSYPVSEPVAP